MHRLNFGIHQEPNVTAASVGVPQGFSHKDFLTMRWRYPNKRRRGLLGKTMIDVSCVSKKEIEKNNVRNVNPHWHMRSHCLKENPLIKNGNATFTVYQYLGTWSQWSYRDESRNKRTREKYQAMDFEFGPMTMQDFGSKSLSAKMVPTWHTNS
jgi:hypothetical protein